MWRAARTLAQGMAFVRIDFYAHRGTVRFGEITFFPTSGMGGFAPAEWDRTFGQMIAIPMDFDRGKM